MLTVFQEEVFLKSVLPIVPYNFYYMVQLAKMEEVERSSKSASLAFSSSPC